MDLTDFEKDFKRVRSNPIYFLEVYYNQAHPDKKLALSDDEKQVLFDKYKGVPLFKNDSKVFQQLKEIEELKKKGFKDWEIF